jgi:hypothetical protein
MTLTQQEWLTCDGPEPMLNFLGVKATERKVRLFAVACCRGVWHLMTDKRSRHAVELAERLADGEVNREEQQAGYAAAKKAHATGRAAFAASWSLTESFQAARSDAQSLRADVLFIAGDAALAAGDALAAAACVPIRENHPALGFLRWLRRWTKIWRTTQKLANSAHAALVRDLFGNPFRPVTLARGWLTPAVVALAQKIYDSGSFDRLPLLANALEEAGCDNAEILAHCRGPGSHVKGCWVVDEILGKK